MWALGLSVVGGREFLLVCNTLQQSSFVMP
jgi:hypothetical protein